MSSTQVKKPRTIKRACEYCKKKHIKCDGTSPCYQCERRDIECIYAIVNEKENTNKVDKIKIKSKEDPIYQEPMTVKPRSLKIKEPNSKKRKIKEFKFIPINDEALNNSIIIKNPPDDTWLRAYKHKVEPFFSFVNDSSFSVSEFEKFMSWDFYKLKSLSIENLVELLPQLTSIAHGSRYCDNLDISVKSIYKALDILEALYIHKAHTQPQYSQQLAGSIESIIFYLTGHGDIYKTRELASNAQHLLNNFSQILLPSTKRTIYAFLIGKTLDLDEMELWINKARMLPFDYTKADISSWVVVVMFLTTKPLANLDKFYNPNLDTAKDPLEVKHYQSVLSIIEYVETLVWNFESILAQKNVNCELTRIYKLVLYGHKALVLCKCGLHEDALSYSYEVINSGVPDICKLPFILSLYYSCLVANYMKKYALYYQGIELSNKLKVQYPLWDKQLEQLSKEFDRSLSSLHSAPYGYNNYELRDESDGSTKEYRSSTSYDYYSPYINLLDKDSLEQFSLSNDSPYVMGSLDLDL